MGRYLGGCEGKVKVSVKYTLVTECRRAGSLVRCCFPDRRKLVATRTNSIAARVLLVDILLSYCNEQIYVHMLFSFVFCGNQNGI